MEFVTNQLDISGSSSSVKAQMPALSLNPYPRRSCWVLCAIACSWFALSTEAMANPLGFQAGPEFLTEVASSLSIIPGIEAIYPALGLLAAVVSTHILRRRRIAQLAAIAAADR